MSAPPKIVLTNPVHEEVAVRLAKYGMVDANRSIEPWPPQELSAHLAGAAAMMGFMTDNVDAGVLRAARDLRIVACALKGFDSYDVEACTRAGVWVSIVPDLLTEPTAELAIGLAIALARNVRPGDQHVRGGAFQGWRAHLYGKGLHGATVAVVGLGRVGLAIVQRLQGFGCARIWGVDPAQTAADVQRVELEQALMESDYVFVAVPLGPATHHIVGMPQLARAKPGQMLINVGRGSVIDERAVAASLGSGALGGYAADVFACEDWAVTDRPREIPAELLAHPCTVFTPHLGSAVRDVRLAIEHRAADNIIDVLEGRTPRDAINRPQTRVARPA